VKSPGLTPWTTICRPRCGWKIGTSTPRSIPRAHALGYDLSPALRAENRNLNPPFDPQGSPLGYDLSPALRAEKRIFGHPVRSQGSRRA
jgi:hypothetical protein